MGLEEIKFLLDRDRTRLCVQAGSECDFNSFFRVELVAVLDNYYGCEHRIEEGSSWIRDDKRRVRAAFYALSDDRFFVYLYGDGAKDIEVIRRELKSKYASLRRVDKFLELEAIMDELMRD